MHIAVYSCISSLGTQFSEQRVLRDSFVQKGAGNLLDMTVSTADDEFRSALCCVHSKTLSQTALHSQRVQV